jgi:hypothetical protein
MMRVLVIIAVTGFLVSVVCLCAAVGIAGPEAIARGGWEWNVDHYFDGWDNHHRHHRDRDDDGPQTTREIAWTGGDSLDVDVPAEVKYTQGPGPAKLVVTGSRDAVADVEVDDGQIRFRHDRDHDETLSIVMTAPSISRFEVAGSGNLAIMNYKQDKLTLDLSGDADITAKGEAKAIDLSISGSGDADLGEVKAQSATVNIEGSGAAKLAPTDAAKIEISGSGGVTLLTHPPKLESNVSGSGSVQQGEEPSAAASSSAPPSHARKAKAA